MRYGRLYLDLLDRAEDHEGQHAGKRVRRRLELAAQDVGKAASGASTMAQE
jgi:hypothetical protein